MKLAAQIKSRPIGQSRISPQPIRVRAGPARLARLACKFALLLAIFDSRPSPHLLLFTDSGLLTFYFLFNVKSFFHNLHKSIPCLIHLLLFGLGNN